LATGLRHRRLAVPGLELADRIASPRKALEGWRDRRVAVVGGGDEASSLAYDLATHGATVSLLVRSALRARPAFAEPVRREPRVAIRQGAVTERFEGGAGGDAGGDAGGGEITVVLTSGERLAVDECFVRIGVEPSLPQIEPELERLADGRLRVDGQMRTSCDTLFAAGDLVRPPAERYIAAALADGAIVARNVEGDLAGASSS
ncbi:MAG: NAD(P)/FAD-dependent oxidoreductase, partial [Acidobacteriota bacterium]